MFTCHEHIISPCCPKVPSSCTCNSVRDPTVPPSCFAGKGRSISPHDLWHGLGQVPKVPRTLRNPTQTQRASLCSKHRAQRLNEDYNSDMKILYRIIDGSCRKYHLCRDKSFVATDTCLSRRVCRDKARPLSRQKYACREKTFVATKLCLSWQNVFVATKANTEYFCRIRRRVIFVATNVCREKRFVATSIRVCRVCSSCCHW